MTPGVIEILQCFFIAGEDKLVKALSPAHLLEYLLRIKPLWYSFRLQVLDMATPTIFLGLFHHSDLYRV